jgi:heme-degrading monooxygenase HmoA
MFARLITISVQTDYVEELKRVFNDEIVPFMKSQKGNLGISLLELSDNNDDFISLTQWVSKSDAEAYKLSGTHRTLVDKLKDTYKNKPVLKSYNVGDSKMAVTM